MGADVIVCHVNMLIPSKQLILQVLPHHATHTHEARSSCFDHAAHASSKDLRRERVVAEPRVCSPFSCAAPPAASPAGAWREPAAARDARVRRVPPAPCTERCVLSRQKLRCAPVLCCSAFEPTIVLISAEFGLDVHGRHKKFEEHYQQKKTLSNHRK